MKIETKYNIGDVVYIYDNDGDWEEETECPACSGKGFVFLDDGKNYDCPKCNGDGAIGCPKPNNVYECIISSISISIEKYHNNIPNVCYQVTKPMKNLLFTYYESEIFLTKEELLKAREGK